MNFETFLKEQLNPQQREAVEQTHGPLLVIAGAGSGKTRVITARIVRLIVHEQVAPRSIVALTFTNKAAKEMLHRVQSFLHNHEIHQLPFIGTFHSFCVQFLKRNHDKLPHQFNAILDTDDKLRLIKAILTRQNLLKQWTPRAISSEISLMKNNTQHKTLAHPVLRDLYSEYEKEKQISKCFDFDDLLLQTVNLLQSNHELRHNTQKFMRHLLVDEYQDTNDVQNRLLQLLTKEDDKVTADSVCAVGDEDQSIYSWRGATVANMLNFPHEFGGAKTIKIEQNYRSVQQILQTANAVIKHNSDRTPKKLWSQREGKNRVLQLQCVSEYQEADAIAQLLNALQKTSSLNDCAILYRTHTQSRALEEAFIKHTIPYKIIGGVQFYDRKEIRDLFAFFKLIANPFDRVSLMRVINVPTRGLGAQFENLLLTSWNSEPFLTFTQLIEKIITQEVVPVKKRDALQKFLTIFAGLTPQSKPSDALKTILHASEYNMYLLKSYEQQEAQERFANIKELQNACTHFEQQNVNTLSLFLQEVALMQDKEKRSQHNQAAVTMMTLHSAKGLEFDTIILPGLEENLLPTGRAFDDPDSLQEERRLFYVGITRARERLLLSHGKYRYTYGKMTDQSPSRFLAEIPQELAPCIDVCYYRRLELQKLFSLWLQQKIISPTTEQSSHYETKQLEQPFKKKLSLTWKKYTTVKHAMYGIGTIQQINDNDADKVILTVRFSAGTKKILAKFLKKL